MRSRTRTALAVLPFALALTLTGCSSDDGGKKVATAEGGKAGSDTPGSARPSLSQQEMGVKFAQCMRKNGVDMEDPKDGRVIVKQKKESEAAMEKAMEKCREFQPQGPGPGQKADPKVVAAMQKYATCMRKNGVEKFPDPRPGGGLQMDKSVHDDPNFAAAEKACKEHLEAERKRVEEKNR
ncbi:hypothetical protein ACFQ61_23090 [Streptomyces sp. NPDC056500]|uniref:hypothetical protein n=1 Tax=Streptomyces sp. NPDC056500 TaxID=3345840 RepID=UPI00367D995F